MYLNRGIIISSTRDKIIYSYYLFSRALKEQNSKLEADLESAKKRLDTEKEQKQQLVRYTVDSIMIDVWYALSLFKSPR